MFELGSLMGFLTALLGLILAGLTLWGKIINGIKRAAKEVLEDTGLIRHDEDAANWPNGWNNLPDALDGLHEQQRRFNAHLFPEEVEE